GIGIALGPFLKPPKVEVLVLQRVCQLVSHDRLLLRYRQPRSQVELLGLRLIESGHLLAQQLHNVVAQPESLGNQPQLYQSLGRCLELGGSRALVQVTNDRLLDLVVSLHPALDRVQNAELTQPAHHSEDLASGVESGLTRPGKRRRLERLRSRA